MYPIKEPVSLAPWRFSNLAAYTLTCPIQGLIVGALSGLSAAAGVMVGKRLGKKEYDEAYIESKKIMYAGLAGAIAVSSLLIIFSGVYTGFYRVDYICFICTC